jgi:hypothetical protein
MGYLLSNPDEVLTLLLQHLRMTGITLVVAIAVAVPISVLVTRIRWLSVPVMGSAGHSLHHSQPGADHLSGAPLRAQRYFRHRGHGALHPGHSGP